MCHGTACCIKILSEDPKQQLLTEASTNELTKMPNERDNADFNLRCPSSEPFLDDHPCELDLDRDLDDSLDNNHQQHIQYFM